MHPLIAVLRVGRAQSGFERQMYPDTGWVKTIDLAWPYVLTPYTPPNRFSLSLFVLFVCYVLNCLLSSGLLNFINIQLGTQEKYCILCTCLEKFFFF
ncbi:hypothetical protein ANANG_G00068190 [Anguilla anguilla]|uniref:Uncharacterized protein n=1 Tax=Anguilla anguilla TaxID=7936 RepID=A0A9D3S7L5_ANGAN|nr:hypothetical protein ANANG_G00068190 [Anguilla anguilla]